MENICNKCKYQNTDLCTIEMCFAADFKGFAAKSEDLVNHPSHYTDGGIEVIDYIEDKGLNYHLGNAVKYISRAGKKDTDKYTEDLEKADWYIRREIERCGK